MSNLAKETKLSSQLHYAFGSWHDPEVLKLSLFQVLLMSMWNFLNSFYWRMHSRYNSVPVAVKVIQPDISSNVSPERMEKFEREAVMLSRVKHDNIVKVCDK